MKATTIALAVTLGLSAGAANAATPILFDLTTDIGIFSDTNVSASFNDSFTFKSPIAGNYGSVAISNYISGNFPVNFTSMSLTDTTTNKLLASTGPSGFASTLDFKGVNTTDTYLLNLKGNLISASGGYTGSVTISPVPEASEWAMMASGLGLFGFIATRRNKKAA